MDNKISDKIGNTIRHYCSFCDIDEEMMEQIMDVINTHYIPKDKETGLEVERECEALKVDCLGCFNETCDFTEPLTLEQLVEVTPDWIDNIHEVITCLMQRCELKTHNEKDSKLIAQFVREFLNIKRKEG